MYPVLFSNHFLLGPTWPNLTKIFLPFSNGIPSGDSNSDGANLDVLEDGYSLPVGQALHGYTIHAQYLIT